MKVAICFWGLNRSTQFTANSIKGHIFQELSLQGIHYDIYMHTFLLEGVYKNSWGNENNIFLDPNLWRLLRPRFIKIEKQLEVDKRLNLAQYRKLGCPWNSPKCQTLDNHIRALYSLKQVTQMMLNRKIKYDYVIFCRPDLKIHSKFSLDYFKDLNDSTIALVNYAKFPVNDRFAICTPSVARLFGLRFDEAHAFSLVKPLHSESYLAHILGKYKINVKEISFRFQRVRATGKVLSD